MRHNWILFVAAAAAASCGGGAHETETAPVPAVPVQTVTVTTESLADTFEAGGTVRARTVAVVSSRILSPVLRVLVRPGDRVRAGQPLVQLDARQLQSGAVSADASLAGALEAASAAQAEESAAQAALVLAMATHERMTRLHARNSATKGELDEATAALHSSEARVRAAKARRAASDRSIDAARGNAHAATVTASYAVLTAPFDGLVTEVPAQEGTMAAPGAGLVTVEDTRKYRLEASIDANRAGAVTVGTHVPVTLAGSGETLDGVVAEITEAVDSAAHAFILKVDLPASPAMRTGLYARGRFPGTKVDGIAVPRSAILRRGQVTAVFTEDGGVARMRIVQAGAEVGDRTLVLAGLASGDRVVVNPPQDLTDGRAVTLAGAAPRRPR